MVSPLKLLFVAPLQKQNIYFTQKHKIANPKIAAVLWHF